MSLAEERYSDDDRPLAPESLKTRRAREKLLRQWEEEKLQITPKAIADSIAKMHKWIADNAKHRVPIKEKLELFNQNRDAAKLSSKVEAIASKLRVDLGRVFEHS
ncbi:MAG TPA: hypothetical protein VLE89_04175 [Chlamydiales bacterium]|nr:hypothetical protein [Chlamydiales bacterium]